MIKGINKGFPVIKKSRAPVYLLNPIKTKYEAKPKGLLSSEK